MYLSYFHLGIAVLLTKIVCNSNVRKARLIINNTWLRLLNTHSIVLLKASGALTLVAAVGVDALLVFLCTHHFRQLTLVHIWEKNKAVTINIIESVNHKANNTLMELELTSELDVYLCRCPLRPWSLRHRSGSSQVLALCSLNICCHTLGHRKEQWAQRIYTHVKLCQNVPTENLSGQRERFKFYHNSINNKKQILPCVFTDNTP